MNRFKIVLLLLCLIANPTDGQTLGDLRVINSKAKVQFVSPDVLDRLMIELRSYETNPLPGQDSLLLETFLTISDVYTANNHFKQAYQTMGRYLDYKKAMLARQKAETISEKVASIAVRQQKDDSEQSKLEKQLTGLEESNSTLETKRLSFKRYFSFIIIVLTSIFAIMLVTGGIKLLNYRSDLQKSQQRMKQIHRRALMGSFSEGLEARYETSMHQIAEENKEILNSAKSIESFPPANQVMKLLNSIERKVKEELKNS